MLYCRWSTNSRTTAILPSLTHTVPTYHTLRSVPHLRNAKNYQSPMIGLGSLSATGVRVRGLPTSPPAVNAQVPTVGMRLRQASRPYLLWGRSAAYVYESHSARRDPNVAFRVCLQSWPLHLEPVSADVQSTKWVRPSGDQDLDLL